MLLIFQVPPPHRSMTFSALFPRHDMTLHPYLGDPADPDIHVREAVPPLPWFALATALGFGLAAARLASLGLVASAGGVSSGSSSILNKMEPTVSLVPGGMLVKFALREPIATGGRPGVQY